MSRSHGPRYAVARPVLSVLVVVALVTGCSGGADEDEPAGQVVPEEANADAGAAGEADPEGAVVVAEPVDLEEPQQAGEAAASTEAVDTRVTPEPDPDARAEDYPDFEWAFEEGRRMGAGYGVNAYEPGSVGEPGMVGLAAAEAYRAGFALGLAQQEAKQAEREAAEAAEEAERLANYPVGEVLRGWDPRMAAAEFWEHPAAETCDVAAPEDPCVGAYYGAGSTEIMAIARLDPAAGPSIDTMLLLTGTVSGFEVLESWTAEDPSDPLPDWVLPAP